MLSKHRLACIGLAVAACVVAPAAVAQGSYPDQADQDHRAGAARRRRRPRRAHRSASASSKALGQPVVVENQSGGGGIVGSQATARAAPDGYTLMVGYVGTHGTNPAVRKLPYDAVKDFTPIAMVGGTPNVLVVPPSLPVKTLPEFIAYAKANKGKLSYGSSGPGTLTHLAMEQFKVADRPRHAARRVSRHRSRDHRHPGRPDAGAVPGPRRRAAAHQGRQDAAARRDRHQAASAAARRADVRGAGLQGLRRRAVVRHRRSGEPAAGDRRHAQHRRSTTTLADPAFCASGCRAKRWSRCR